MEDSSTKIIIMKHQEPLKMTKMHVSKMRKVTEMKSWNFTDEALKPSSQYEHLQTLLCADEEQIKEKVMQRLSMTLRSHIKQKICSYRSQDMDKKIYNPELFIQYNDVLAQLQLSSNQEERCIPCYYCQKGVLLLYECVREPRQWTVERIDNSYGHNRDNITIACLHCNLRRRTMYHERYLMTKQMVVRKMEQEREPTIGTYKGNLLPYFPRSVKKPL